MANDYGPSIRLTKLYRKTSKNDATYFTGRIGSAKVALLKSNETGDSGDEVWNLVLSEAPAYKAEAPAAPGAPARYVPQTLEDDASPFASEWR